MIEDFAYDFGVLYGRENPHPSLAFRANTDVDVEDSFEEPGPGHSFWGWLWNLIWLDQLQRLGDFWFFRNDLFPEFVVRR